MAKQNENRDDVLLDDDAINPLMGNADYELEDEAFFKKYEPKRSRIRRKKACDARRRLEAYREAQELKEMLADFYDD